MNLRVELAKDVLKYFEMGKLKHAFKSRGEHVGSAYLRIPYLWEDGSEYFINLCDILRTASASPTEGLKEFCTNSGSPCEVCNLGALFYAHLMRFNGVSVKQGVEGDFIYHHLAKVFSYKQLALIEVAYERGVSGGMLYDSNIWRQSELDEEGTPTCWYRDDEEITFAKVEQVLRWASIVDGGSTRFKRFRGDDTVERRHKRLVAIMENVIANDGEFIPTV